MFYNVKLPSGKEKEYPDRDVLHFKVLSKDGYIGRSFIDTAKEEFGGALATQRFSNNFWQNGASPGLVVKMPHQLSQEGYERLKHSLQGFKGGNAGKSLPLDQGADVQEVGGIPQRDAQFLETKKFSKEQIASIFRVPLPLINSLDNANYSNVTALTLNFAKYTMSPLFSRMEAELNRKLRPRTEQGRQNYFFEHDMTSLLRGDDATRAEYYSKLFGNSVITPNEIRDREGLNKLDISGMDVPYKQKQDVPIFEGSANE
jgi:HK97 family phage portal protein